ncbi:MAG: hypothetical protein Q9170_000246 [Blastenia crenularia]
MQVAAPTVFMPHNTSTNIAAGIKRPRSNTAGSTSSSRRTKSRASTTSVVSSTTQPLYHHQQSAEPSHGPPPYHVSGQPFQYTPEQMITHSEQQLTNPNQGYAIESSGRRHVEQPREGYAHERSVSLGHGINIDPTIQRPSLNQYHSYEGDSQGFEHANGEQVVGDNGTADGRKKKGSASSIANDIELKKLFRENTRRLGMRGESKYHYVDLTLADDQPGAGEEGYGFNYRGAYTELERSKGPQLPADTAVFPSPDIPMSSTFGNLQDRSKVPESLYLQTASGNMQKAPSRPNMVNYELRFSSRESSSDRDDEAVVLPSIHGYVPIGTDPDTAEGLAALYRTHCISVIDSFRFCKERMLWHHFTSFHGLLAVPVQKLFAHPSIAAWIKECDWLMYQKMVRFVSPLALQVVPMRVIDTFRAISTKLAHHLTQTFQNHPQHVRDAKLGPATVFAGLLDRLLRVNATAHAAANMLTNDANRDQMWHDWVLYVKPLKVVESSLPGVGFQRTLQILATEMRHLLGPLRTTVYGGMDPIYSETLAEPSSNYSNHVYPEIDDSSTEGVLDRWTDFLARLPSLFPRADARTMLHCAGAVGNAALRDITIAQALSFGSWWVTKTWVDEMLLWMAEKGGFMGHTPDTLRMRGRREVAAEVDFPADDASEIFGGSRPRTAASESVDPPSRFGSVDVPHNLDRERSARASVPYQEAYRGASSQSVVARMAPPVQARQEKIIEISREQNPDDSGIGMDMEPEDSRKDHYDGFVTQGSNLGSDPADVVVC